jgi:hypothetical protein
MITTKNREEVVKNKQSLMRHNRNRVNLEQHHMKVILIIINAFVKLKLKN